MKAFMPSTTPAAAVDALGVAELREERMIFRVFVGVIAPISDRLAVLVSPSGRAAIREPFHDLFGGQALDADLGVGFRLFDRRNGRARESDSDYLSLLPLCSLI